MALQLSGPSPRTASLPPLLLLEHGCGPRGPKSHSSSSTGTCLVSPAPRQRSRAGSNPAPHGRPLPSLGPTHWLHLGLLHPSAAERPLGIFLVPPLCSSLQGFCSLSTGQAYRELQRGAPKHARAQTHTRTHQAMCDPIEIKDSLRTASFPVSSQTTPNLGSTSPLGLSKLNRRRPTTTTFPEGPSSG